MKHQPPAKNEQTSKYTIKNKDEKQEQNNYSLNETHKAVLGSGRQASRDSFFLFSPLTVGWSVGRSVGRGGGGGGWPTPTHYS